MNYIRPENVISPKAHWALQTVLLDGGEGECAYALGRWDGEPRIGFRWNGSADNPIGNPQSRGLPTWTMLDPNLHEAVLSLLPTDMQVLARRFFSTPRGGMSFDGVTLTGDRTSVLLYDMRQKPALIAVIACSLLRDVVRAPSPLSEDECRLVADANKELLSGVAYALFRQGRARLGSDGKSQSMELQRSDLEPVAPYFETTVLELSSLAGWR